AVGRPAPAHRDRPGAAPRPPHPRPRRRHERHRRPRRRGDPHGAAGTARPADDDRDRPPAVDDQPRRPGGPAPPRAGRRVGHARRADGDRAPVRRGARAPRGGRVGPAGGGEGAGRRTRRDGQADGRPAALRRPRPEHGDGWHLMAWGGGGGVGGGRGGAMFGGAAGRGAGNLPFAGVPPELQSRVDRILEHEPSHDDTPVPFEQVRYDRRPLTLRRFLSPHRWALGGALLLVLVETAAMQAGPLLTQQGIDRGIRAGDTGTLLGIAALYLLSVVLGGLASGTRVAWTGRVGARLLLDLRIRVFSHLPRLSLDFFTREKAGRLMTRMTSDLEALTQ